jgi:membrane protease YdiL (CAAX protease family)
MVASDLASGGTSMDAVAMRPRAAGWSSFVALLLMGLLGVAVLVLLAPGTISSIDVALLVVATAVGVLLAERVGLVSLVARRAATGAPVLSRLTPQVLPAVAVGLAAGFVITALDFTYATAIGADFGTSIPTYPVEVLAIGVTYGAITEELLLRWGLMTFLVWVGWRVGGALEGTPGALVAWAAIVLAAVLFGVGHLPALAAATDLTPAIVARTILLNAVAGIAYGWVYWRRSLEAGMIAHAATHVGFFVFIPLLGLLFVR